MKKYFCIFVCFLLVVPVFLYSQTAQRIEDLLNYEAVSYEQAAWLVLDAADISDSAGISSQGEAFRYAVEQQWVPGDAPANGRVSLERVSLLIMQAFGMRGGLLYTLTKSPHYAYRELIFRNVIVARSDPQMAVSGYWLLFMVNRVLSYQEANAL